ncbi:beta-N-acetylhexosaminidase [Psychromonas ossibalaenae]|uniref:beta-N-acetylhexosaminidase n=1 Tax=Psychromonas ossibalaenae TaxID=444922 RepID=UPI00036AFB22|nr:beta-N-acetylhexosaminidase [Psychromonas ossibalaenae]
MRPLILDVQGYLLDSEEKEMLAHPLVAGIILFTRNFADINQLKDLVKEIRYYAGNDILIAVDHEGGRVQRFRDDFTLLPSAGSLLELNDLNTAEQLAFSSAWVMAAELTACDIDLSFAPVLDINGISDVIQNRAFSSRPDQVIQLSRAYITGMKTAGMCSTGKHFPGHGSVKADSHIALPSDNRSKAEIFSSDILPFSELITERLLDAVMPSHVVYPHCDAQPAGFSSYWLQDILRKKLNFNGVIISDDLSMHGASFAGNHLSRAEAALNAGCDLLLACNDRDAAVMLLDNLKVPAAGGNEVIRKLQYVKNRIKLPLKNNPIWLENQQKLLQFAERI